LQNVLLSADETLIHTAEATLVQQWLECTEDLFCM